MTVNTLEASQRAYDAWHSQHGVDARADDAWHLLVREHLDPARDLAGRRVLEIGAGRGGFACWLSAHPARVREIVAADFSAAAVEKGRSFAAAEGYDRIAFEQGDIQNIAHPDESFDTVFSCETIEHVPDPERAVRELARVLRPGGRLFLTTPNYLSTIGLYRAYLPLTGRHYDEGGQPINNLVMLPRTIRWVRRAGLRVRAVDGRGHYLPVPGRAPIPIRALDRVRPLSKWFAVHSLVVAEKRVR